MDWASLVLRLGIGIMFMGHGLQKTFGMFGGPGIKGFSGFLSSLGFAPAIFWAYLAACTELIGGLLLILGIGVRTSTIFLIVVMLVAAAKVHLSKGFFLSSGGFEYIFVIVTACAALIILGAGKYSLYNKF